MEFRLLRSKRRTRSVALGVAATLPLAGIAAWLALTGGPSPTADPLSRFLIAVGAIVLLSHLLGALAARFGQPRVVGEIAGGLLLGPSALGAWWPPLSSQLFTPDVIASLNTAAQLGLVFFVYLLGAELTKGPGSRMRTIGFVTAGSLLLPFGGGMLVALGTGGVLGTGPGSVWFFGLALAITALPVLARILEDRGLTRTPLGAIALTSAAIGDAVAWLGLTVLLTVTGAGQSASLWAVLPISAGLALVSVAFVRPGLAALARRAGTHAAILPAVLVAGALGYAALSQAIGLHPAIGAFVFGLLVPRDSPAVTAANTQLRGFTFLALLPLFFVTIGLKTSLTAFGEDAGAWLLLALVLVVAMATKFAGAAGGALLGGLDRGTAVRTGTLMNCRGVTELIVATIGLNLHLVSELGYTILVLVALITTALTGPLLRLGTPTPT